MEQEHPLRLEPSNGDKEAAIARVTDDWEAFERMSEVLRNDKDVVMAAVRQNGQALKYASEGLQNNKEVVLTAVA